MLSVLTSLRVTTPLKTAAPVTEFDATIAVRFIVTESVANSHPSIDGQVICQGDCPRDRDSVHGLITRSDDTLHIRTPVTVYDTMSIASMPRTNRARHRRLSVHRGGAQNRQRTGNKKHAIGGDGVCEVCSARVATPLTASKPYQ